MRGNEDDGDDDSGDGGTSDGDSIGTIGAQCTLAPKRATPNKKERMKRKFAISSKHCCSDGGDEASGDAAAIGCAHGSEWIGIGARQCSCEC